MSQMERQYSALVVEDDAHTRELVVFNLEDAGYRAYSAANGVEASHCESRVFASAVSLAWSTSR